MEIRAAGEFIFDDMVRVCRALILRRKWLWYSEMILGGLMVGAGALLMIVMPAIFADLLPLVVVGLILGSMGWWIPLISARIMWRNNRVLPGRHEFLFDDSELTRRGSNNSVALKWSGILSWREDECLFTLFTSPGTAMMVPKRFLSNAADEESLHRLFISKIGSPK